MKLVKKNIKSRIRKIGKKNILITMNNFYELNELGETIFKKIDGTKTIQDIEDELFEVYDVSKEVLKADINDFINFLLSIEAIEEI